MKKILSLALASALALGMSVTAFATAPAAAGEGETRLPSGKTSITDAEARIVVGTEFAIEVETFVAKEKVTLAIKEGTATGRDVTSNFTSTSGSMSAVTNASKIATFTLKPNTVREYSHLYFVATSTASPDAANWDYYYEPLVIVKAAATTTPGGSSTPAKNSKITKQTSTPCDDILGVDKLPGDTIPIPLTSDMFEVESADVVQSSQTSVTQEMIRNGKVEVRTAISTGSKAVSGVAIDYEDKTVNGILYKKTAVIKVKMIDPFVSVDEADFALTVYLVISGDRTSYKDLGVKVEGTLANPVTELWADEKYVDSSKGEVIEAMEYNKNVEVDLGLGVSIHTKMFKGKSYYGIADGDRDEADDVVFAKYPDVDRVFTLKTVGLNSTGDIVKLNLTGDTFWVYNADMKFIGMSNEMLPYSTKYYVANKELAVEDAEGDTEEPEDTVPEDTEVPSTGGAEAPANANNNPSTGC